MKAQLGQMKLNLLIFCCLTASTLASDEIKEESKDEKYLRAFVSRYKDKTLKDMALLKEGSKKILADFQTFIDSSSKMFADFKNETEEFDSNEFQSLNSKFLNFTDSMKDIQGDFNSNIEENFGKILEIMENCLKYFDSISNDPVTLLRHSNGYNDAIETIKYRRNQFLAEFSPYVTEVNESSDKNSDLIKGMIDSFRGHLEKFSSEIKGPESYQKVVAKYEGDFDEIAEKFSLKLEKLNE